MPDGCAWEAFFDAQASTYLENGFTQDTLREVDFILSHLNLPDGASIFDVGCGAGRHALVLAAKGYKVTGIDISEGMLREARECALTRNVEVEWIQADATQFVNPDAYDAAVCLCEGALGLLNPAEDGLEHDLAVLGNIARSVKPGGPVLLTALNAYRVIREATPEQVKDGTFDPIHLVYEFDMEMGEGENRRTVRMREHLFTPPELKRILEDLGLEVHAIWGGTAGNWAERPLDLDEMEMMIFARRKA